MPENKCDQCEGPMPLIVGVFLRRPSDPTDLCSIMWICEACATSQGWEGVDFRFPADRVPSLATYDQALAWTEDHGMTHESPVLFVT